VHYNIAPGAKKYFYFYSKKIIHCGDGDVAGITEPVRDRDEIRNLISARYGQGNR